MTFRGCWTSSKEERKKVINEVSKYSKREIEQFEELFPITNKIYDAKSMTHNTWCQNIMPIGYECKKENMANITFFAFDDDKDTYKHFWERWNRFKNLIAFI
jgi:hypothetical protein